MASYYKSGYESLLPPPSPEKMTVLFTRIFKKMENDWELSLQISEFGGKILFILLNAERCLLFDLSENSPSVSISDENESADVKIRLTLQDFHLYWCRKIELLKAVTLRKIRVDGPFDKLMRLNELVSAGRKMYLNELANTGFNLQGEE